MPTKLNVALLGMMFGGAAFLTSGFALFPMINLSQDPAFQARGPVPNAATVSYAQLDR